MTEQINRPAAPKHGAIVNAALLCAAGIVLNLAGSAVSAAFHLPIYFDTAGTILAAVLGGYLPGILAGFFTNILLSIREPSMLYYGAINMIVAICASAFAQKGWFKSFPKVLAVIPPVTLITGVLGGNLTWFLNNSDIGGQFNRFATQMHENMGFGRFGAQMAADLLYELVDKTISILLVFLLLRLLPGALQDSFRMQGRWQAPLSEEMKAAINRQKGRGVSLRVRVLLALIAGMVCISATAVTVSLRLFKESTIEEYTHMARLLTSLVAGLLEDEPIDEYLTLGHDADGYDEVEQQLYKLMDSYPDVEYLYVYRIEEDGCHVVFDLDTPTTKASEPGAVEEFDESFEPYLPALLRGEPIDPIVSDDTFGWLLTVYYPVRGAGNVTLCYVGADYSMNMLSLIGEIFIAKLASLLLSAFIVVLALALALSEYNVILPVKSMAYCAGAFAYDSEEEREENIEKLRKLEIRTGDEIEELYHAFLKTTEDSMHYVDNLLHARMQVEVMKEQVSAMDEIAYKDALTGLKNKASYDQFTARLDAQIVGGSAVFGIAMIDLNYLKRVNDTYGHEHGNDYIKACCKLVCTAFEHSPVFRVGGDEFVVILENSDLAEREKLVDWLRYEMKKKAADDTLQPWEKVSAAVGVALYDAETDQSAEDVFKRADQAMYADKQAMKAVRTD